MSRPLSSAGGAVAVVVFVVCVHRGRGSECGSHYLAHECKCVANLVRDGAGPGETPTHGAVHIP